MESWADKIRKSTALSKTQPTIQDVGFKSQVSTGTQPGDSLAQIVVDGLFNLSNIAIKYGDMYEAQQRKLKIQDDETYQEAENALKINFAKAYDDYSLSIKDDDPEKITKLKAFRKDLSAYATNQNKDIYDTIDTKYRDLNLGKYFTEIANFRDYSEYSESPTNGKKSFIQKENSDKLQITLKALSDGIDNEIDKDEIKANNSEMIKFEEQYKKALVDSGYYTVNNGSDVDAINDARKKAIDALQKDYGVSLDENGKITYSDSFNKKFTISDAQNKIKNFINGQDIEYLNSVETIQENAKKLAEKEIIKSQVQSVIAKKDEFIKFTSTEDFIKKTDEDKLAVVNKFMEDNKDFFDLKNYDVSVQDNVLQFSSALANEKSSIMHNITTKQKQIANDNLVNSINRNSTMAEIKSISAQTGVSTKTLLNYASNDLENHIIQNSQQFAGKSFKSISKMFPLFSQMKDIGLSSKIKSMIDDVQTGINFSTLDTGSLSSKDENRVQTSFTSAIKSGDIKNVAGAINYANTKGMKIDYFVKTEKSIDNLLTIKNSKQAEAEIARLEQFVPLGYKITNPKIKNIMMLSKTTGKPYSEVIDTYNSVFISDNNKKAIKDKIKRETIKDKNLRGINTSTLDTVMQGYVRNGSTIEDAMDLTKEYIQKNSVGNVFNFNEQQIKKFKYDTIVKSGKKNKFNNGIQYGDIEVKFVDPFDEFAGVSVNIISDGVPLGSTNMPSHIFYEQVNKADKAWKFKK